MGECWVIFPFPLPASQKERQSRGSGCCVCILPVIIAAEEAFAGWNANVRFDVATEKLEEIPAFGFQKVGFQDFNEVIIGEKDNRGPFKQVLLRTLAYYYRVPHNFAINSVKQG